MNENSFFFSDIYKEATDVIKNIMDDATKRRLDIFGKVWFKDHFTQSRYPRTESEFTAILEEVHAAPAASTINEFSERPIRSLDGFGKVKAQMLSVGHTYKLEAEDLRAIRDMQRRYAGIKNHEELVRFIVEKLMNVRTKAIQGVLNRQDLLILTMLSNDGKYTFTAENDPGSPFIGQTLDFGFDASHAATVTTPWTDANIDTVDVLEDIMGTIDPAVIKPTEMYMERERIFYMLRTKKLKLYVNGSDRASQPISLEDMNNLFARFDLPAIKLIQREVRVDSDGGKTTKMINPWKKGKILFTIGSNFGTIERKITDAEDGLKEDNVNYAYYDGIEVMNWTQGVKEGTNYTEFVSAGLTSTPVVDSIRNMYTLDTKA